jgi:hypothetical protein
MKTYFDIYLFTHYIPLDRHNVTLIWHEFVMLIQKYSRSSENIHEAILKVMTN